MLGKIMQLFYMHAKVRKQHKVSLLKNWFLKREKIYFIFLIRTKLTVFYQSFLTFNNTELFTCATSRRIVLCVQNMQQRKILTSHSLGGKVFIERERKREKKVIDSWTKKIFLSHQIHYNKGKEKAVYNESVIRECYTQRESVIIRDQ